MEKEDDLLIIGLCASCGARVSERHGDDKWKEKPTSFEIV